MKLIRTTIVAVLFLITGLPAQTATVSNQWTTTPDGTYLDGHWLTNLPPLPPVLVDNEYNVKSFGAVCDGITDDTAAVQTAINFLALTNHGGTLYFPIGVTKITQVQIPTISGQPNQSVTIRFRGALLPSQSMFLVSSGGTNTGGSIIKSVATGGAGTSIFSAGPGAVFNPVTVVMENLTWLTPVNTAMIGLNCRNAYALLLQGVRVWTGVAPFDITTAPNQNQSVAIATPANNNAAFTAIYHTDVSGWFTGYELSEHAVVDYSSAWACLQAATFPGGYHSIKIGRFGVYHCQYGFGFTGVTTRLKVEQLDIEHANGSSGAWKIPIADIYDPSGLAVGEVEWATVLQNVGISHVFIVTGGANLQTREIGSAYGGGATVSNPILLGNATPPVVTVTNTSAIYVNTNTLTVYYWYNAGWH